MELLSEGEMLSEGLSCENRSSSLHCRTVVAESQTPLPVAPAAGSSLPGAFVTLFERRATSSSQRVVPASYKISS